ncbi:MAG: hypothetical protein HYR56_28960 [Acidobacteria bacterium]|nr:hypothetical protein [Acidobacteriota bacterium]MBI3422754.1 hypothetical protein [Acidobacteriota bacterium]
MPVATAKKTIPKNNSHIGSARDDEKANIETSLPLLIDKRCNTVPPDITEAEALGVLCTPESASLGRCVGVASSLTVTSQAIGVCATIREVEEQKQN